MAELLLTFDSQDKGLSVRGFSVREGLSSLFEVSVVAMSESPDLDLESIVGKPAELFIKSGLLHAERDERRWKGVCSYIEQAQAEPTGLSTYVLTIVPRLWLLTRRRGYRVFQRMNVQAIVDDLLEEWSIKPAWEIAGGDYPKLDYKVQYGESDFDFLCRLLEEAGITYSFPDGGGSGTSVTFSDELTSGSPHAASPIPYVDSPSESAQEEFLTEIRMSHGVRPGAYTLRDHDLRNPRFEHFSTARAASAAGPPAAAALPTAALEQYHYLPGASLSEPEGDGGGGTPVADDKMVARHDTAYGALRAERALSADRNGERTVSFDTNVLDLAPGVVFSVDRHPHKALAPGARLLVVELHTEGSFGDEWRQTGRAVFADVPFRPPMVTPKPEVKGVQCAVVVGPEGQEIHTDEFGRVRVQFPWDREGKLDDNSSCWIRVSQGWAGAGFGMIQIPRVGQEVLVAFLGGDPDQPIIVGRVFNATSPVPYKLPDHKTRSAWKSDSSPGGGGYNEILFEDLKGSELLYMQAERDLRKLVKNDETEQTLGNHKLLVGKDQDIVIRAAQRELVGGDSHLHVRGARREMVDMDQSTIVVMNREERVGMRHALDAGQEIHLKAGTAVIIEGALDLTLKGPGGFIRIDPGGVVIAGKQVKINSGGSPGSGMGAMPIPPDDAEEAVIVPPVQPTPDDVRTSGLGQ